MKDPQATRGFGSARQTSAIAIRRSATIRLVVGIVAVLAWPAVSFAQVKVILSGGFSAAYREALPEFERTTGIVVTTASGASQGNGPNTIGAQLRRRLVLFLLEPLTNLVSRAPRTHMREPVTTRPRRGRREDLYRLGILELP